MITPQDVAADVFDIGDPRNHPRQGDEIHVDTNVWLDLAYVKLAASTHQQPSPKYEQFVKQALAVNGIVRTGLSFPELANRIERHEYELWHGRNGRPASSIRPGRKDFRKNATERFNVVGEIDAAWTIVAGMSRHLDMNMTDNFTVGAIGRLRAAPLDCFDALIIEACAHGGRYPSVLTTDSDFAYVQHLQVFTANQQVLAAARAAGQTLHR